MVSVSGVRGIVGKTMTPEVAVRFAGAVGTWLVRKMKRDGRRFPPRVGVSWDGRASGDALYHAAVAGLRAAGCRVERCGVAMTPTLAVYVDCQGWEAGIQITASHNPQEWNGLKVLLPDDRHFAESDFFQVGAAAPPALLAGEIIRAFTANDIDWAAPSADGGNGEMTNFETTHPDRVFRAIEMWSHDALERIRTRAYKVLVDDCNASGSVLARDFFSNLGCTYTRTTTGPMGIFPHVPEPTEANLTGLAAQVTEQGADIGFAQDPDADRLAIIDENGTYIGEEYTLVLAALALAEIGLLRKGSIVATNLSTSRMIEDIAAKYGASVMRTAVGEANVVEAMKKIGTKCVLGGEGNGGVIWPRVTYVRDSLSGMALVLALMAKTGKTVSQLVSGVPSYAIVKRKVDVRDRSEADRAAAAVKGHFKGAKIDTQDGVRVDVDDATYGKAWLHVRASNTEPIMRLIAEAPTKGQAEKLLEAAAKVIG